MSILQRVLVALDEEGSAEGAFAYALDLERAFACELVLCTALDRAAVTAAAVTPDGVVVDVQAMLDTCSLTTRRFLDASAARAAASGARATTRLLDGRAGEAIVDAADAICADAIVLGTHGRTGVERAFFGSTAAAVLRTAKVPVFVVRAPGAAGVAVPHRFERILVAIDDSEPSDAAVAFATALAAEHRGALLVCNVMDAEDFAARSLTYGYDPTPFVQTIRSGAIDLLQTRTRAAAALGLEIEHIVVEGDPPQAILHAAIEHAADLIVIGTHGRRGLRRLVIGSVAESVIRRSALPVAAIRVAPSSAA